MGRGSLFPYHRKILWFISECHRKSNRGNSLSADSHASERWIRHGHYSFDWKLFSSTRKYPSSVRGTNPSHSSWTRKKPTTSKRKRRITKHFCFCIKRRANDFLSESDHNPQVRKSMFFFLSHHAKYRFWNQQPSGQPCYGWTRDRQHFCSTIMRYVIRQNCIRTRYSYRSVVCRCCFPKRIQHASKWKPLCYSATRAV